MALTREEIKNNYPLPVYNYTVEIAGEAVGFSEVSGLNVSYETTTYKESRTESGIPGPRLIQMPAQATPPTLTLKKGLVRKKSLEVFYQWLRTTQTNQVEKKDIAIRLCDEKGDAVVSWTVLNAFPTKLEAPSFTADSNDAAIESLELAADEILIEEV